MDSSEERRKMDDRRKFNYTAYVPERRSGRDRRDLETGKLKIKMA